MSAYEFFYVMDSNKILAVSVSAFLWFKNLQIKYNKWINIIGGATFGVLLIHANCEEIRIILWHDIFDCIHKYNLPIDKLILFSVSSVLLVFGVCVVLEILRQKTVERMFFNWFDRKFDRI